MEAAVKLTVTPVAPIGARKAMAFVEHVDESLSGLHEVELPIYPDSPHGRKLRELRIRHGVGLRYCSELLGLTAVEVSGLERGSHTTDEWDEVFARLASVEVSP